MDKSSKFFDNEECREILDDRGYDDQDKGVEIVDNRSTASPTQFTIGAKHTHISTNKTFNNNCDKEKGGEIVDDEVDDDKEKGGSVVDDERHDDQDKNGEIVDN